MKYKCDECGKLLRNPVDEKFEALCSPKCDRKRMHALASIPPAKGIFQKIYYFYRGWPIAGFDSPYYREEDYNSPDSWSER